MSAATVTWDPDVNALCIELDEGDVLETVEVAKGVHLDVGSEGQVVGIEILNADAGLIAALPALPDKAALRDLLRHSAA